MNIIPVICGPTASGKTDAAIKLAKQIDGELISIDSRQIYKYLPIGTNLGKVDYLEEFALPKTITIDSIEINKLPVHKIEDVKIHMVNFLSPKHTFNLFVYKELVEIIIEDIFQRNKTPILVGGTGLYIDSLLKEYHDNNTSIDQQIRSKLNKLSLQRLQDKLKNNNDRIVSEINNSDWNNKYRLIRLIEKDNQAKVNRNDTFKDVDTNRNKNYDFKLFYPVYNWQKLKNKIENRVENMFHEGLVDEVKNAIKKGFNESDPALKGTGFKEVIMYLDNKISLEEAVSLVKKSHMQYAKRQRTWFEGKGRGYKLVRFNTIDEIENEVSS